MVHFKLSAQLFICQKDATKRDNFMKILIFFKQICTPNVLNSCILSDKKKLDSNSVFALQKLISVSCSTFTYQPQFIYNFFLKF